MKRLMVMWCLIAGGTPGWSGEMAVSSREPVEVTAPEGWKSEKDEEGAAPFETYRVRAPGERNAECLISILAKDRKEFEDAAFLQRLVRGDSRPYVASAALLAKVEVKELKLNGGKGYYANFVDPDMAGKPVKKGRYKTATPMILSVGSKYLVKVTVLCDEIEGADYRDLLKLVESIHVK